MKSQFRVVVVVAVVSLLASHARSANDAQATSLTAGRTLAAPGSVVSVPIDLVNPNQDPFTSIDVAVRISGESGNTPLIVGFDAPAAAPFVWAPFSGVTLIPAPNNPLAAPVVGEVLGVAGSGIGVQTNMDGRVMDLSISVPADAELGSEFQIDLIDDLSFISNLGAAEHFAEPFQDGAIKIVTNEILTDYNCVVDNLFTTGAACGDLNSDGFVDGSDFNIVMGQVNGLGASPALVPEPGLSRWLVCLAIAVGLLRRRR